MKMTSTLYWKHTNTLIGRSAMLKNINIFILKRKIKVVSQLELLDIPEVTSSPWV